MRVTQSFSLSLDEIKRLKELIKGYEFGKSKFVGELINHEWQRTRKNKQISDGQTILETHIGTAEHREARKDGKCNPNLAKGRCATCWGDLHE